MAFRDKDIHKYLGPKTRHDSMMTCLAEVRKTWPKCYMEGSTGFERSFWVDRELVAHAWPVNRSDDFWLRVKPYDEKLLDV